MGAEKLLFYRFIGRIWKLLHLALHTVTQVGWTDMETSKLHTAVGRRDTFNFLSIRLDQNGRLLRVGVLDSQWIELCFVIWNYVFSEVPDRFVWDLDVHGIFSMSSTRRLLDSFFLDSSSIGTRWNTLIPINVNDDLIWRIMRDRIPTRLNLRAG